LVRLVNPEIDRDRKPIVRLEHIVTNQTATRTATTPSVIFGVYSSRFALDSAVNHFKTAGFQNSQVSVLLPDEQGARAVEDIKATQTGNVADKVQSLTSPETKDISSGSPTDVAPRDTKVVQGAGAGAGIGAMLGGSLGWIAAFTGLAIPGVGAFLVAGPLLGMLAGGAAGGAVGLLVGLGIPEDKAKLYEDRLKDGGILLSVHVKDLSQADRARQIFQQTGAMDIATTSDT
jgi:hypothetical protein